MDDSSKLVKILLYLAELGYTFKDELDAIRVIQRNQIDISNFELPYGAHNLEEYEQILLERKEKSDRIQREAYFDPDPLMTMY